MEAPPINQDEMEQLLEWIDSIPFSKPKRNLARDFADGVFIAEIMKMYKPQLVQLHNYPLVSSLSSKFANWKTLNDKVFRKMKFQVNQNDINGIIACVPGSIERVLYMIYTKIKRLQQERLTSDFDIVQGKNVAFSAESKLNTQISAQLAEKEQTIKQLRSTIQILQTKMRRMQELNRLKDAKIDSLIRKLQEGIN